MYEATQLPPRMKRHADLVNISYMALLGLKKKYKFPARLTDKSDEIIDVVCDWFGITKEQIFKHARYRKIVEPRQIAMFLLLNHTNMSLKNIGDKFGGFDHTSVIHAKQAVKNLMETDEEYRLTVQSLEVKIQ